MYYQLFATVGKLTITPVHAVLLNLNLPQKC